MEESIETHVSRIQFLADLNTEQIRSFNRDKTAVLIPGGVLEEHGPFLPCSTDTLGSEHLTRAHFKNTDVLRNKPQIG